MDNIVLKTEKYNRLTTIGNLAAEHLVHEEFLISLLVTVEQYLLDATLANLHEIKKSYDVCNKQFPSFFERRSLIFNLMCEHGIVNKTLKPEPDSEPEVVNTVEEIVPTDKNNIVNIFGKPVDQDNEK